jgi:hypothetical protein
VLREATLRIQFVCCPEGEADERNRAQMETPEIPPMGRTIRTSVLANEKLWPRQ